MTRCAWAESSPQMLEYHDTEWGVPELDSRALWEQLILEGFQAGLSWSIILKKREAFREAFRGFDPAKIARFTARDVERLVQDEAIVRSRAKIEATIGNARAYLEIEDFSKWVQSLKDADAEQISKELKRRGFKFVGPTIVYSWMQATGIVNGHTPDCFRRTIK
jgi:DNA-3-methyladenine glycosylase I